MIRAPRSPRSRLHSLECAKNAPVLQASFAHTFLRHAHWKHIISGLQGTSHGILVHSKKFHSLPPPSPCLWEHVYRWVAKQFLPLFQFPLKQALASMMWRATSLVLQLRYQTWLISMRRVSGIRCLWPFNLNHTPYQLSSTGRWMGQPWTDKSLEDCRYGEVHWLTKGNTSSSCRTSLERCLVGK